MAGHISLSILNNLIYKGIYFSDSLTFRKIDKWISQLDLGICHTDLIDSVADINANQDTKLPSDHAIVSMDVKLVNHHMLAKTLLHSARKLVERVIPVCVDKGKRATLS